MSKLDIAKFLMSAFNMVKRGDIKSEQDLIKFAKQQFGDLDSGILGQIKDVFTKGKAAAVTETRTKDIMRGDPTGEKKEGLISLTKELEQNLKDLKDLDKQQTNINEELMDAMMGFREAERSKEYRGNDASIGELLQKIAKIVGAYTIYIVTNLGKLEEQENKND